MSSHFSGHAPPLILQEISNLGKADGLGEGQVTRKWKKTPRDKKEGDSLKVCSLPAKRNRIGDDCYELPTKKRAVSQND